MIRSHHGILIVRVYLIGLQELMQSTFGVIYCPVAVQFRCEVCLLRLHTRVTHVIRC